MDARWNFDTNLAVSRGYALRPARVEAGSTAHAALEAAGMTVLREVAPWMPVRSRARRGKDAEAFQATLMALLEALALGGLLAIPNPQGIKIGLRRNAYSGTGISHTHLSTLLSAMKRAGLVSMRSGYRDETGKGKVSRMTAPSDLLAIFDASGVSLDDLRKAPESVLLLRKAEWSDPPPLIEADSGLIHRLNATSANHELRLRGDARARVIKRLAPGYYYDARTGKVRQLRGGWDESSIYLIRIFSGSWDSGGRLYGGYWQNTPHEERIHFLIDGEETVEVDYSALHPRLLYAMEGATEKLAIDPYAVPGFEHIDRAHGKVTFARLLNGRFREAAEKQPWRELHPLRFNAEDKALFSSREEFRDYVSAMRAHLHIIEKHFGQSAGLKLQKTDSDLALSVVLKFVNLSIPIYPIHDSFIVRKQDESFLRDCMAESMLSMSER